MARKALKAGGTATKKEQTAKKETPQQAYQRHLGQYLYGTSETAKSRIDPMRNYANINPAQAQNYLKSSAMLSPDSLKTYDADVVRKAVTDRAAIGRDLTETGYFDTPENAYTNPRGVSTQYLRDMMDYASAMFASSKAKDDKKASNLAALKAASPKDYLRETSKENSIKNWLAAGEMAGKRYGDENYDPTDDDLMFWYNAVNGTNYKNMVDMQQRMGLDTDGYSDQWDKMVDLWYEGVDSGKMNPDYYKSDTGMWQERVDTMGNAIGQKETVAALESEARGLPNFAEGYVYKDPNNLAAGSDLERALGVPEELRTSMYADRDYFIANPISAENRSGWGKTNKELASYFDSGYQNLTGYEKDTYFAFVDAGMLDKADEYLKALSPDLMQRSADTDDVLFSTLASDPMTAAPAAALSVIGSAGSGFAAPFQAVAQLTGNVQGSNDPVFNINRRLQTIRDAQLQGIGEADPLADVKIFGKTPGQLLYSGGMGALDNLARAAAGPSGALALAGGQSFSSGLFENADREGMSNIAKVVQAGLGSLVEIGTEKIGLDALFDMSLPSAKQYIKQLILSELGEETLAYIGDDAVDKAVAAAFGHKATFKTAEEFWQGLGDTILTTLISSGGMSVPGAVTTAKANRQSGKGIQTNDSIKDVLEIADSMGKDTASYAEAQRVKASLEAGETVGLNKMGRLANAMQQELGDELGKVIGRVANDAIVDRMVELGDSKEVAQKNVEAVKKSADGLELTEQERAAMTESNSAIQVVEELAGKADTSDVIATKMQMRAVEAASDISSKQQRLQDAVYGKQIDQSVFAEESENAPATVKAKPGTGTVTFLGEASSNQDVTGVGTEAALTSRMRNMTASQRNTVNGIKAIAKATGVNMVLFESTAEGRAAAVQNGSFVRGTNTIYLDINAGISTEAGMKGAKESGVLGYAMIRTLSHELTHFIEANGKEGYNALMAQAKREFAAKGKDWDRLVEAKAKASAAQGEKLTRTGAEAEVLADACEMMLQDTAAIERLARQNPSLKDKIAGFIKSFVQKIQKALRTIGAGSKEAKTLMEMRDGLMQYSEELTRLWGAGLEEAVGNAQSVKQQADGEQMEADGEVRQHSLRDKDVSYKNDKDNISKPKEWASQ